MKYLRLSILIVVFVVGQSFRPSEKNTATLGNDQIVKALKQALQIGTDSSVVKANKTNGFFGNPLIKIPFPPDALRIANVLRSAGFGHLVDDFVLKLNRAAENASGKAKNIFIDAITTITINDGLAILKGGNDAATQYLKSKTYVKLKNAFKPDIRASLANSGATVAWANVTKTYNRIPRVKKISTDLPEYATGKTLDGLFVLIAQEEAKIRKDPKSQVTDLLKTVFGKLK